MHACLELHPFPGETLQTASLLCFLLEYGYLITVLCQYDAAGEASQSASYDNNLLHLFS